MNMFLLENIFEFLLCRPYVGIWALVVGRIIVTKFTICSVVSYFNSIFILYIILWLHIPIDPDRSTWYNWITRESHLYLFARTSELKWYFNYSWHVFFYIWITNSSKSRCQTNKIATPVIILFIPKPRCVIL